MTTIRQLTNYLESIAPASFQESYDNAGLIVGHPDTTVTGVVLCLDSTEAVIDEAIERGCNVVIAHHPIVFRGLKRFNGSNYVERTVIKAIKNDIAIYAIHTNLDNVYAQGVNAKIAERLALQDTRILAPKKVQWQLQTTIAKKHMAAAQKILQAADLQVQTGAATDDSLLHYTLTGSSITIQQLQRQLDALAEHPAVSFAVDTPTPKIGAGMIGQLETPMDPMAFLTFVKDRMQVGCIKYTALPEKNVARVAVCGGAGGFLLSQAIRQGADVFITSDYKYHEFFDADGQIVIADIGHYESEQFTSELLYEIISQKFSNFALHCTKVITNPVRYL
jgi:dinuclear metal center YbgI/SA1388 family protein